MQPWSRPRVGDEPWSVSSARSYAECDGPPYRVGSRTKYPLGRFSGTGSMHPWSRPQWELSHGLAHRRRANDGNFNHMQLPIIQHLALRPPHRVRLHVGLVLSSCSKACQHRRDLDAEADPQQTEQLVGHVQDVIPGERASVCCHHGRCSLGNSAAHAA